MLEELRQKIKEKGGFVNAHSHLDRANTARFFSKEEQYKFLEEKWKLVDRIKKDSNYWAYYSRIDQVVSDQIEKGVSTICTFVDVDPITTNKAYIAAHEVARARKFDITLLTAMQTLKGVLDPNLKTIVDNAAFSVNIIGSLPGADRGREDEHIDWVMNAAKRYGKRVHVHVDQLNTPKEKETEWLARKTIEYGLEGKVTAVHSISLACHPIAYRKEVYKICQDAGLSFITCPGAWIDHPRREDLAPIHNAITPVDELLEHDLVVAIGSDNIYDVYKPFADGDMMFELRLLLEACKIYDVDELVKIATSNGKKVLGLR
jgi:cytosine/creatinine deaminase